MSYQYFGDLDRVTLTSGSWKVPRRAAGLNASGQVPIWSCMTLKLPDGFWLGHDRPYEVVPDGQSSGRTDGSVKWITLSQTVNYWTKNSHNQDW